MHYSVMNGLPKFQVHSCSVAYMALAGVSSRMVWPALGVFQPDLMWSSWSTAVPSASQPISHHNLSRTYCSVFCPCTLLQLHYTQHSHRRASCLYCSVQAVLRQISSWPRFITPFDQAFATLFGCRGARYDWRPATAAQQQAAQCSSDPTQPHTPLHILYRAMGQPWGRGSAG
jgi:hypothetical protein